MTGLDCRLHGDGDAGDIGWLLVDVDDRCNTESIIGF
jgi:hypothetical protein